MSIEGVEARLLAEQLDEELTGRRITGVAVHDVAGLQPSGFVNADLDDFQRLVGGAIGGVASRGNTIKVSAGTGTNLVIGPEYGGRVLIHDRGETLPAKTHLVLTTDDGRRVSIRLTGMGVLRCDSDAELEENYVYQRDFGGTPDPTCHPLSSDEFESALAQRSQALKSVLVGKTAMVVGISNAGFQDILFRAGLHPKRKAADLTSGERTRLGDALRSVIEERLTRAGKVDFVDLYGRPGEYEPSMGPHRKNTDCDSCGSAIESVAVGGGRAYYCPGCQR